MRKWTLDWYLFQFKNKIENGRWHLHVWKVLFFYYFSFASSFRNRRILSVRQLSVIFRAHCHHSWCHRKRGSSKIVVRMKSISVCHELQYSCVCCKFWCVELINESFMHVLFFFGLLSSSFCHSFNSVADTSEEKTTRKPKFVNCELIKTILFRG